MKTDVEKIDLAKAITYLKKNVDFKYDADSRTNRPVTLGRVLRYATDMLAGRWVLTNQGIGFDKSGNLVDGQKRLLAVKMAAEEGAGGYPPNPSIFFETQVTRGLGDNVFPVIDTGETRNTHQILAMNGIRNGLHVGAAARLIYCFDNVEDIEGWSRVKIPNTQTLQMVQELNLGDYYKSVAPLKKLGLIGSSSIAGIHLCSGALENTIRTDVSTDHFIDTIRDGAEIDGKSMATDDPRWAFREYLIRSLSTSKSRKNRDSTVQLMVFIKCWNDYVLGQRRMICSWRANEGVIRPVGWEG